jgi:hypothetical protein
VAQEPRQALTSGRHHWRLFLFQNGIIANDARLQYYRNYPTTRDRHDVGALIGSLRERFHATTTD